MIWSSSYEYFAQSFYLIYKHDLNALGHVFTTGLGLWGAIQMAVKLDAISVIYIYAAAIALMTPYKTAILQSAFVYSCLQFPVTEIVSQKNIYGGSLTICIFSIAAGFLLQDFIHWFCCESTMLSSYIKTDPTMLIAHTLSSMPVVLDSILMRHFFIPKLFVSRNRNIFCKVASRTAVEDVREWINQFVPQRNKTAHLWPHEN